LALIKKGEIKMRRTASEIIRNLQSRVARLEKSASYRKTKIQNRIIQAKRYARVVYSPKPITSFRNVRQGKNYSQWDKPKGLWYSFGKDWKEFVQIESLDKVYPHKYLLEVNLNRMYVIRTEKELLEFTEKYGYQEKMKMYDDYVISWGIDWIKVSRDYDGIEICPKIPKTRQTQDYRWYEFWDVASGCIWGKGAIKDFTEVDSDIQDNEFRMKLYS
jgi:hypothetical protein